MQTKRPSFVGSDHGDEIFAVLGLCFITTHIKLSGKSIQKMASSVGLQRSEFPECKVFYQIIIILEGCEEDEEQLSRTMMSYWGNFARTG